MVQCVMRASSPERAQPAVHYASYIVVGAVTTAVNAAAYLLLRRWAWLPALVSNFIAWLASVAFAYFANRSFVFGSAARRPRELFLEAAAFLSSRAFSLLLDMGMMWAGLRLLASSPSGTGTEPWKELALKLGVNAAVIAVNYLTGKIVFNYRGRNR